MCINEVKICTHLIHTVYKPRWVAWARGCKKVQPCHQRSYNLLAFSTFFCPWTLICYFIKTKNGHCGNFDLFNFQCISPLGQFSCNDLESSVCLYVCAIAEKPAFRGTGDFWSKNILLILAYLKTFLCFNCFNDFSCFLFLFFKSFFWSSKISLPCIMGELARGGYVPLAVGASDRWHLTRDTQHIPHDTWHMTCETWHMTCDTWHIIFVPPPLS